MKLLVVASSLDLRRPLSATPAWWQLLKALAERGVELVVTPYQGPAIEAPWWTAAENPCLREGDAVGWLKQVSRRAGVKPPGAGLPLGDRVSLGLVERVTRPRWRRHLARLVEQHRDVAGVLFLTVPPNHFAGIPEYLRRRFGVPTYLYDGDAPASLPRFAGFQTGFRIYDRADLSEYESVISSSAGSVPDLERLGARNVRVLYYGVDTDLFAPLPEQQDIDVLFYGHGGEYREEWIDAMVTRPSHVMPDARFAVRGRWFETLGQAESLPYLGLAGLRRYCCRSRINLNITRQAHASVFASSTSRPFELAALGCAIVSNPYLGIEEWFEPGREVLVVRDEAEAVGTYRSLLHDAAARRELGARARARVLAQHTYRDRARELLLMVEG